MELRLLKLVERALREDHADEALRMLGTLAREAPHGRMQEERDAAEVIARCRLNLGAPAHLLAELAARYPNSAYLPRVVQACTQ
ncbi:MAG: hypothetical protein RL385_1916 [Pseudomonadota bacterium]|jgi:hypothetical protein